MMKSIGCPHETENSPTAHNRALCDFIDGGAEDPARGLRWGREGRLWRCFAFSSGNGKVGVILTGDDRMRARIVYEASQLSGSDWLDDMLRVEVQFL